MIFETKDYIIRIDRIQYNKYRYASWKQGQSLKDKPDIILENGEYFADGTGGNWHITFKNGIYRYELYRYIIGKDETPDAELLVYKNDDLILNQDIIHIKDSFY